MEKTDIDDILDHTFKALDTVIRQKHEADEDCREERRCEESGTEHCDGPLGRRPADSN